MKKIIFAVLLFVVNVAQANLISVNPNFEVQQVGVGNGVCSPDPACGVNGWGVFGNNATVGASNWQSTQYTGHYAKIVTTLSAQGGYGLFSYRYWIPVTKSSYTFKFGGMCNVSGGLFYLGFYDANKIYMAARTLVYPVVKSQFDFTDLTLLNTGSVSVPLGAKYMVLRFKSTKSMFCMIDNVNLY